MKIQESKVRQWETEKTMCLGGSSVSYRVLTEEIPFEADGKIIATAVTYSYIRDGVEKEKRPVLFAYNGGPGSSSVWLHLGLLGPMRVRMETSVNPSVSGPFVLEENPFCILDAADVVLLDPPGCGFGTVAEEERAQACFGVRQDAGCAAGIIERWLTKQGRFSSPKYLLGESYGTVRTCMLLRELMGGPMAFSRRLLAIPVDGVIMMGTALNLAPLHNEYRVEESILQLIGMTATRLYHRPLTGKEKEAWLRLGLPDPSDIRGMEGRLAEAVWRFCGERYLTALFWENELDEGKREAMMDALALLTGVARTWFERHGLAISAKDFRKECLRKEGMEVGAYDGRYTFSSSDGAFLDPVADDPAMGQYTPFYVGAMNGEMRRYLGIEGEMSEPYRGIDFAINGRWDYETPEKPEACLEAAMRRNPRMRVLFMTGIYDLVTPPGGVRYLASHQKLPGDRILVREYASGHMPYLGREAAGRVSGDLRAFLHAGNGAERRSHEKNIGL